VLARLAENLFWAGRYLARAEETARLVDVTYHRLLEAPPTEVATTWEQLLEQLHVLEIYLDAQDGEEFSAIRPDDVLRFLVTDEENPSSVLSSIQRVRENARTVRELISNEVWTTINELYLRLGERDLAAELTDRPYEVFRTVIRGCQTVLGVLFETMPRDDAYMFLALGQMLERAEMTSRLVDVRYGRLVEQSSPQDIVTLLRSIGALESYRRRFGASTEPKDVLSLLVLDEDHPRSVLFALDRAEGALRRISGGHGRSLRAVGRARAGLRYRDVDELLDAGLHEFLQALQSRVREASEAIAGEFFRQVPPGAMHTVVSA
jgi:uncharacterized alpha-E superfamily protein